jgi:hypothetical protein
MQPPWKLVVEDLGRISHAEIEARPLLLFVGPNNTGKTYLASLLWGLLSLSGELPLARGDAYQRCVRWIEERYARREQEPTFEITPEIQANLVQIVNDMLSEQKAVLAERTFNQPGFRVAKIELRDVAPYNWPWRNIWGKGGDLTIGGHVPLTTSFLQPDRWAGILDFMAKCRTLGALSGEMVPFYRDVVFLPAPRTGFMLLYRSLAQQLSHNALIKTGGPRPAAPDLTAPAIHFVDMLMGLRPDSGGIFPEEAAFLERAMGGRLALRSDVGLNEILYEHAEGEPALPMQLSSSLVTELAPVVLTLRHVFGYRILIIEEPEAHLHPHLQRVLAQVIVRLVRKGRFVWITTHSENFCQQINNFLKIGSLPPDKRAEAREKLGYAESDYLELDDVGGYDFRIEGSRTVVEELVKTPRGVIMPTFNRELYALAKEIDYLDDLLGAET